MVIKLIYFTSGGTTKITTEALKKILILKNHEIDCINVGQAPYQSNYELVYKNMADADIVGFGSPAYHMDMIYPMIDLMNFVIEKDKKRKIKYSVFFYLNYGGITSGKAFANSIKRFQQAGIRVLGAVKIAAPHFYHNQDFSESSVSPLLTRFVHELEKNNYSELSKKEMQKMFTPKLKIRLLYPLVKRIGKIRHLKIEVYEAKCKKCMKCFKECPVSAISMDQKIMINQKKCISCYHCVKVCPFKALSVNVEKLEKMIQRNIGIIGTEDPTDQIYTHQKD